VQNKILFILILLLSLILVSCGQDPYLIGEIEERTQKEIVLSVKENNSNIEEIDKVIITQKTLMDFTMFQEGVTVKVTIYEEEFNDINTPPKVPLKDIEVIE
jgi:hypothetical protein